MITEKPTLEALLLEKNFRSMIEALAYKVLKSSYRFAEGNPLVCQQDLISEAITAACAAYKNFDPEKGAWTSYTYMYVLNAMQTFAKKNCHSLSISERESRDNLSAMTGIGIVRINDPYQDGEEGTQKFDIPIGSGVEVGQEEDLEVYFQGFSPLDVSIFKEHIFEEKTIQQIATKHKLSKSVVYITIDRMSKRMRDRISREQNSRD